MFESWARQIAAMSAWQLLTVIALAGNLVIQMVRLQKMEDITDA